MARPMQWFTRVQRPVVQLTGSQGDFILYNSLSLSAAATKGATVTRLIIDLIFRAESLAQFNEVAWGITTVNADASAAGALPDSDDDTDRAGWLVRGREYNIQDSLSDASQWTRVKMDIRSQRVLRSEQDELHLIVNNHATGFSVIWSAFIRTLMKLP